MKKLKVEFSYRQALGLDDWLHSVLPRFDTSNELKCVAAVIHKWRMDKLKPKTYYPTNAPIKFTLDLQTCFAFASVIERMNPDHTDPVGARLTKLYYQIHQTINN